MRYIAIFAFLIFSCSNDASNLASSESKTAKNSTVESKEPDMKFSANVEGMICKMGCVASIRKELSALNGVGSVKVDFIEDEPIQLVEVSYNKTQSNETLITKTIESINNKQFQVSAVQTEKL
ncbi:heavy-metal-associated domain-containing protein [Crocinitomicaceae bacterium]|jgi:copper chaperone CopZ|nr:heavy-metal-associated domain-containing protein [Flavobacteriales bacterium]MDA8910882.1 heavy-metal-associated domain-containing protein [Crocinitomicaceae bacterium]MDC0302349.1 heavy-metal-associated domain-containing protein [bacterium]MBT5931752.1 heavy-metal-associated domain-containing protein [Flavobacteriales bacterium]MDC0459467.1 heavy-metal-associated domain-containing protein [Crocinitomicaceae bacterium]